MKIDKKQINYLSRLAKIELSEKQKAIFSAHISEILDYVEKIKKVKTHQELYAPISDFRAREDTVINFDSSKLLKNAPEIETEQIKVKAVFKKEKSDL